MEEKHMNVMSSISHIYGNDTEKVKKIHKIYNIYLSNGFENGISIKASRFNHSCQPNAKSLSIKGQNQIGAISDIKQGEEITISYEKEYDFGLRNREFRRENLLKGWFFICSCVLCENGPEKNKGD